MQFRISLISLVDEEEEGELCARRYDPWHKARAFEPEPVEKAARIGRKFRIEKRYSPPRLERTFGIIVGE